LTWATRSGSSARKARRRAQRQRGVELGRQAVDGDYLARAGGERPQHRGKADAAQPDHGHRLAQPYLRRVDCRAHTRQYRAAEHGGDILRQVGRHLDQRTAIAHGKFGETRHADLVVQRRAVGARQMTMAADHGAGGVGDGARFAQRRAAFQAGQAVAATGHEDQGHGIAALEVGDARSGFLDHAGGLVAQGHGHRPRAVAIDDGEVRMAQPGGGDFYQHLVGAGAGKAHGLDGDRAGLRVGARLFHLAQHGGADLHEVFCLARD
jgi:hypothetical protein